MKYTPPLNSEDPDAIYVNADPANGQEGSIIPAGALENPQREIVAAITKLGMTPAEANNQLGTALFEAATISDFCTEASSSAANVYVLSSTGQVQYSALTDGQRIRFKVVHPNSGSATGKKICRHRRFKLRRPLNRRHSGIFLERRRKLLGVHLNLLRNLGRGQL